MTSQRIRVGSNEHKELFCRTFIETHEAYDPATLPWPELDEGSLKRLRAVPFWGTALQIERNAGFLVNAFAKAQPDTQIREAIALQGYEEDRHAKMIGMLVDRYGLSAETSDELPKPTKRAFIDFGYNECLDSFFGFGVFRLARDARVLPGELISLFTRVLHEEARHIVFFVNWIAYDRAQRGYGAAPLQVPATALGYFRSLARLINLARGGKSNAESQKFGDAFNEVSFANLTLRDFVEACIQENDRQMASLDPRLLRPRVIPSIARFVLGFMKRQKQAQPAAAPRVSPNGQTTYSGDEKTEYVGARAESES
jgi:hypothetical protein